jgi:hypothetical protein
MIDPGGHLLDPPVRVQQNSVYPSQHRDPQAQELPEQEHTAAYADWGRSAYAAGAVASAVPTRALLRRKPRRSEWRARKLLRESTRC